LQGVSLAALLVSALLVVRFTRFQGILLLILGVCAALLPLLLFEIRREFVHTSNMIQYVLEDQHKISFDVLGRRWKIFLGQFFPSELVNVIGRIP
ncbi:MAG: hypothetical protein N3A54_07035, partial [Patescibacteria group bacterium]|nr:hypothetical protein [Patescibacteria group bacterium]